MQIKYPLGAVAALLLTGCGGGGGSDKQTPPVVAEIPTYKVETQTNVGGIIAPASAQVQQGLTATFSVTVNKGYRIDKISGCGGNLNYVVFTTGPVTADCKIEAVFSEVFFQVETPSTVGGRLSQQNPKVKYGEQLSLTLLPDAGFDITTAFGCGGKLDGAVFTTAPIVWPCTIEARFNTNNIVVFPDTNLASAVRQTLSLGASADIPKVKLEQLTYLGVNYANVINLAGLQYAKGLRQISVEGNMITDLTPLLGLSQLQELNLSNNPQIDLKQLSQMSNLRILQLHNVLATDLTPLRGLKLTGLGLRNPAVLDLSPLKDMPLQDFKLSGSATTDLSALSNAPLQTLNLFDSKVTDLSVLKNLSSLQSLNISGTDIVDLSPLTQSLSLAKLNLYNTRLQDLSELVSLNFAKSSLLFISGCIDQNGYSLHLEQLKALKAKYNLSLYLGSEKRQDCIDTLVDTTFNVNAQVANRNLEYSWQINGSSELIYCTMYLDPEDQLLGQPTGPLQACPFSGSASYSEFQADQFRPAMWFDNGIGGEKLIKLTEVGAAPATAKLQSLDLSQITISPVPLLIVERDGLLRLHVTAAQNPALMPQFQVELSLNGNRQQFNTTAPDKLPSSKIHRSLKDAYHMVIPAPWMKPGLKISVLQDDLVVRSMTPAFAEQRPLAIRIVPLQLGTHIATLPDIATVQATVKTFWPFAQVDVKARAPYQLKATGNYISAYAMLDQLRDLRAIEGEGVYYYGYFKPEIGDGCCKGLGYLGDPVAVGIENDSGDVMAHELGHNFDRLHVQCFGEKDVDTGYPYRGRTMGAVGLSLDLKSWISPSTHADIMSYCSPKHVSDYNVAAVQDFVQKNPPKAFPQPKQIQSLQSDAGRGLYLSGTLDGSKITVRTLMPLSHAPSVENNSEYIIRVLDSDGIWSEFNLKLLKVDHPSARTAQDFQVELPELTIRRLEIWRADVMVASQDNQSFTTAGQASAQQQLSASQIQLKESANQICVNWPAGNNSTLSLLYQLDGQDTVLALNETDQQFCRDSTALAPGGHWQLILRQELAISKFSQAR